jgi:hypothetical protein
MGKYNSPTGGGRYLEFTPEIGKKISEHYKDTLVLSVIGGLVERDPKTIKGWIERGFADHQNDIDSDIAQFFREVKKAWAEKINSLEKELLACGERWQALGWYLERTTRKEFGLNAELDEKILELHQKIEELSQHHAEKNGQTDNSGV